MLTLMSVAVALWQPTGIVVRPDVKLPYLIEGKGAPVLMLSGGPGFTCDYMQEIVDGVGKNKYRWILLEQRGTPRAKLAHPSLKALEMEDYVNDLEALRRQLGLKRWTVVGQSWGTMLAQGYAVAHPDRVQSLVLLDTAGPDMEWLTYSGDNISRALNDDDRAALKEIAARDAKDPNAFLLNSFVANLPAYVFDRNVIEKHKGAFQPGSVEGSTVSFIFANLVRDKWDVSKALSRYRGPALVIQGRQDFLGESAAMKSARAMPHGELCFIERAGHIAWWDRPGPFFSRLGSFLKRNAK